MARVEKKEKSVEKFNSVEGVRLWARTILDILSTTTDQKIIQATLVELDDIENPERRTATAVEIIMTALQNVRQESKDQDLYKAAEGLFAVALGNLDKLKSPDFVNSLIAEYFPEEREKMVAELLKLQKSHKIGQGTINRLVNSLSQSEHQLTQSVIQAIEIIIRKIIKNPEKSACFTLFHYFQLFWPSLNINERETVKNYFIQLRNSLVRVDKIGSGELTLLWFEMLHVMGTGSDSNRPELGDFRSEISSSQIIEAVLDFTPTEAIDAIGYALKHGANEPTTFQKLQEKMDRVLAEFADYPQVVIEGIIEAYVAAGFVSRYKNERIKLTAKGLNNATLGKTELESVILARRLFTGKTTEPKQRPQEWGEIKKDYATHRERVAIPEKEIVISGNSRRILFIGELNIGHIAFDEDAANALIDQIKNLPEEEKPHLIVVSGLVAGGYHFKRKAMREQLAIESMDKQFAYARLFMDKLIELGIEVSYVLSSEDFAIAHNYTVFAYQALDHMDNPQADPEKDFVPYWMVDQMQAGKRWDQLNEVQINAAMHYYYRCGRRMRSADEVRQLNSGKGIIREEYRKYSEVELKSMPWAYVRQEEFFIFFDALDKIINGEKLPAHYLDILEMDNFPIPGKVFDDFNCHNGLRITSTTETGTTISLLHHNGFEASSNNIPKNPVASFGNIIGPLAATSSTLHIQIPHEFVNFHSNIALGAESNENGQTIGFVATPGFARSDLLAYRSQTLIVPGSQTARDVKYGRLPSRGGVMREVYGNGEHVVIYPMTTELMDWSAMSAEQMAWLFLADNHFGSQAAYIDGLIRFIDYALKYIMANHPTIMALLGDLIQGRNVRSMPQESAIVRLPSLEHQLELANNMYYLSLSQGQPPINLPNFLNNLNKIYMVAGNHEQNSLPREMQSDFLLPMFTMLNMLLTGSPFGGNKVERLQSMTSAHGEQIYYPGGITDAHGGINAFLTHVFYKGKYGERDPIESARKIAGGFGADFQQVKLMAMGDKHVGRWGIPLPGILVLAIGSMCWSNGYERGLGFQTTPNATILKIGGGLPPEIHYFFPEFIQKHQIESGPFSPEFLADMYGITTGAKHQPHHGLYNAPSEDYLNELQIFINRVSGDIVRGNQSWLGAPLRM